MASLQNNFFDFWGLFAQPQNFCPKNVLNYLTIRTILPNYISPPTPPPNLAWKFFFRVQTGLTYPPPTGASVLACAPKSGAKLPLPCPGLTCPGSPCGLLTVAHRPRLHTPIWRGSSSSVSRLALPTLPRPVPHFQGPQTSPGRTYNCCVRSI